MKVRTAILLTSTLFVTTVSTASEPVAAQTTPAPDTSAWWFHGYLEVGGRVIVNGISKKDLAKFQEYRDLGDGVLSRIHWAAGTSDGLYQFDFWARNVGYDDQSYYLNLSKAGEHYLSFGWDQTPHTISTSAKSLFNVSGNRLTVADPVQAIIQAAQVPPGPFPGPIAAAIDANVRTIGLGTRRDRGSVKYRYTPTPETEIQVAYAHESRTGNRPMGVNWGTGGFASNIVEIPRPISDSTQTVSFMAQYAGLSFWGQKFNVNFKYAGSLYQNNFDSLTIDNPFCITCIAGQGPNLMRVSLEPDNQAHSLSLTSGLDLPFNSRYMGTMSYNMMRQNQPFIPQTINPLLVASPLPAASLNGEVNTLLTNNVLTTRITPDLKSTLRYRYYTIDNRTPPLTLTDYVVADSSLGGPRTSLPLQYTKQNIEATLDWRVARWLKTGVAYGWERYDRTNRSVDVTNENSAKIFADVTLIDWARLRSSLLYAQRRYENYDECNFVELPSGAVAGCPTIPPSGQNPLLRKFDVADRDRIKVNASLDVDIVKGLTVTPTFSLRSDVFVDPQQSIALGVTNDRTWNAGVELTYMLNRRVTLLASYMHERATLKGIGGSTDVGSLWNNTIRDTTNTFIAGVNIAAIPNKLDFKFSYTYTQAVEKWDVTPVAPVTCPALNSGAACEFPDVTNHFHRFDAVAKYTFDQDAMRKLGWAGDKVFAKLRYIYERNNLTNWASGGMVPYMFGTDPDASRSIFLAYNNPNYNVHLIAASLGFKW